MLVKEIGHPKYHVGQFFLSIIARDEALSFLIPALLAFGKMEINVSRLPRPYLS